MSNVILSQLTLAIAMVLNYLLTMYWWVVLIAVLLTWVNADPYTPIVRFLRGVTEPVFYQIRRRLPFVIISGIDLSPLVVILLIEVIRMVVVVPLVRLGQELTSIAIGFAVG